MNQADALAAIWAFRSSTEQLQSAEKRWEFAASMLKLEVELKASTLDINLDDASLEKQLRKQLLTFKQEQNEAASPDSERDKQITDLTKKLASLRNLRHAVDWTKSRRRAVFVRPTSSSMPDTTDLEVRAKASGTPEAELRRIQARVGDMTARVREKVGWLMDEVGRADEAAGVLEGESWDPVKGRLLVILW